MNTFAEPIESANLSANARIVVAMSGGVDSSVAAALLHAQGYEVIGITLQLYDQGEAAAGQKTCCAGIDIYDAKRVAEKIGIPHYVLDYEKRFKDSVIAPFAASYVAGETPVPCIQCNQHVKFHDLLNTARELGADAMATGHYIRSQAGEQGRIMRRAVDAERDQSYFLFTTTQEQLDFLRFPLGGLPKDETRALARKFELEISEKPDSQDICFVPKGHYSDIVEKHIPSARIQGEIRHVDGTVLGEHEGITGFTIGQRRGIGVATGHPLYVIKLDPRTQQVTVGPKEELLVYKAKLRETNWLGDVELKDLPKEGLPIFVKVRSTQPPRPAVLHFKEGQVSVTLPDGEFGVSPGQACVFYDNTDNDARILGGGWITSTGK